MKKGTKTKVAVGVGLGLAAAAASAGYYLFGTQSGKATRKKAAKWADDLKRDVVKKAKKLEKFDAKAYQAIIDEAAKAYESVKSIDKNDLKSAALELKKNWKHIEAEMKRVAKKETTVAKKAIAKAAKKATPKKSSTKKSSTKKV